MEGTCSSKMLVAFQRTTRRYIPEVGTHHNHCCENLKSYTTLYNFKPTYKIVIAGKAFGHVLFYNYNNRPTKPSTCSTNVVLNVCDNGSESSMLSTVHCKLHGCCLPMRNVTHYTWSLLVLCASISHVVFEPHELCLHILWDVGRGYHLVYRADLVISLSKWSRKSQLQIR
jgi:hypothetical protein